MGAASAVTGQEGIKRTLGIGAEWRAGNAHVRVWAPKARRVEIVIADGDDRSQSLWPEANGYFSALLTDVPAGTLYGFRLDGSKALLPDPASRYQPDGPRGRSQMVDPSAFVWSDDGWPGVTLEGQVLYEMHLGTFTPEGTWLAAQAHLADLADLGVTTLEIMPVAEFPGRFGWSYDPANLFAPSRLYGGPDDFRRFVDAAHRIGIGVILDVVYNHVGHVGEGLLRPFSEAYFSTRHDNEWGAPLNFDDEGATEARAFVLDNVRYWIAEFHLDGFRLDATQAMFDDSPQHILLDISRAARGAGGERGVLLIAENEPQDARLVRPGVAGGYELDALVNDDFHHSALVRLTGRREAYYTDYRGSAEELIAAARWGFLFQGQRYAWQAKPRGTAAFDLAAPRFVHCLENHDQLANSASGARVNQLTSPGRMRAMTTLLLLSPQTPMLFQGQEFGATTPFLYFNDCGPEQADEVRRGRADFLAQFPALALPNVQAQLADPYDESTFRRSVLDHAERELHRQMYDLHRDLLRLRREDPVLCIHDANFLQGATLGPKAFVLRFMPPDGDTRLLVVNLDCELCLDSVATPLVAAPFGMRWGILWSSESPRYGCNGTPEVDTDTGWRIPGEAAVVLHPISHVGDS